MLYLIEDMEDEMFSCDKARCYKVSLYVDLVHHLLIIVQMLTLYWLDPLLWWGITYPWVIAPGDVVVIELCFWNV